MRSLPFQTAASRCAPSDLGMRPESRSRSRPGRPPPPPYLCAPDRSPAGLCEHIV